MIWELENCWKGIIEENETIEERWNPNKLHSHWLSSFPKVINCLILAKHFKEVELNERGINGKLVFVKFHPCCFHLKDHSQTDALHWNSSNFKHEKILSWKLGTFNFYFYFLGFQFFCGIAQMVIIHKYDKYKWSAEFPSMIPKLKEARRVGGLVFTMVQM
jgi:hypothetical protein